MKTQELFEEFTLSGYLNIQALASALPGISDIAKFDEALDKIRLGQSEYLTIPEKMQLAQAFIGLLGLNSMQKSQVLRLLSAVRGVPVLDDQQPRTPQQSNENET